jgi:ubiquinone/menaquinone biosynthesis C-methylase UbiE
MESQEYNPQQTKQHYDEFYEGDDFPELLGERKVAEALVSRAHLEPGDRVLDVPCGTGKYSTYLSDAGLEVTGVDISHTAVRVAADGSDTPFVVGDAVHLPIRDDSYDAVFCHGFSLFNDPDLETLRPFMHEVARVLEPGGTFLWGKTTTHQDRDVGSRYDHSRGALRDFFDSLDGFEVVSSYATIPHVSYFLGQYGLSSPLTAALVTAAPRLGVPTRLYFVVQAR